MKQLRRHSLVFWALSSCLLAVTIIGRGGGAGGERGGGSDSLVNPNVAPPSPCQFNSTWDQLAIEIINSLGGCLLKE